MTTGTYGHVVDELDDAPRIDAERAITDARAQKVCSGLGDLGGRILKGTHLRGIP
jgi:hypothetical protein